jgi:transposase
MAKHRKHSIEFKRQVAHEFVGGETLLGLAKRHNLSRSLIRVWVRKYEEGAFDKDAHPADLMREHEARIATLERLVGKQALELELLKETLSNTLANVLTCFLGSTDGKRSPAPLLPTLI